MMKEVIREYQAPAPPPVVKKIYECTICQAEMTDWHSADKHDLTHREPLLGDGERTSWGSYEFYWFDNSEQAKLYARSGNFYEIDYSEPGWYGKIEYKDGDGDGCEKWVHISEIEEDALDKLKGYIRLIRKLRTVGQRAK